MKMIKSVGVYLLPILLIFLASCERADPTETTYHLAPSQVKPENISIVPKQNPEKNVTPIGVDIIMDTTDSMAGYAQSPALQDKTAFVRTIEWLCRAATGYSKTASVRYFRTDVDVIETTKEEFQDFDSPAFYKPKRWYTARNYKEGDLSFEEIYSGEVIANAVRFDSDQRLKVVITDLFENQSTNNELITLIKTRYLNEENSVAVLPVISEFDGYVYDVFENLATGGKYYHGVADSSVKNFEPPTIADIGKWEAAVRSKGANVTIDMSSIIQTKISGFEPKVRPFYMIIMGKEGEVQDFLTKLTEQLEKMPGEPIQIGSPPLAFTEYAVPELIGTSGAGDVLEIDAGALAELSAAYFTYLDREASDEGSLLSSTEQPKTAKYYRYDYPMNQDERIRVSVPASLIASAEDPDNPILSELYGSYEVVMDARLIPVNDTDSATFEVYGEKKRRYVSTPNYDAQMDDTSSFISTEGGSFQVSAEDPLRADGQMTIVLDPARIPEEVKACRIEIELYIRRIGEPVLRTTDIGAYPWAGEWALDLSGQTIQSWEDNPSLQQLDKTINLDSFVGMLISSKADVRVVSQEEFPDDILINSCVIDLFIKRA